MSEKLGTVLFFSSFALLAVLVAFVLKVGWLGVWFDGPLRIVLDHLGSVYMAGQWQPRYRFLWAPPGAARERIVIHRPDLLQPGYRAVTGWDGEIHRIWLLDRNLEEIHSWPIDYPMLDPDAPPHQAVAPHGVKVLEDGSVLVNFDFGKVLARLDVCGDPIWVLSGFFHHSIENDENGSFWTWRSVYDDGEEDQYLVNFDPWSGKTIKEYSLVNDFILKTPEQRMIFGITSSSDGYTQDDDPFHPNDIEPLSSSLAKAFPEFQAGDLLVSFREIHLVAILDPFQHTVKWWSHGPWRFQHDPDFSSDGKILVYNNNTDRGRSNLIAIDPTSRRIDVAYSDGGVQYYSAWAGKHQRLPDGSMLIVVPYEGRVLEASWSGDLIFEFNNIWSDRVNSYVANAVWLPMDFFDEEPSCRKATSQNRSSTVGVGGRL